MADTVHKNKVQRVHDLGIKIDTINKLVEQGIVYLSDLWRREEFLTKQETESIIKCKMKCKILITLN